MQFNNSDILLHTCWSTENKHVGGRKEQSQFSYIAVGFTNWYNSFGKLAVLDLNTL
jgi:hypothetical protein